MTTPDAPDHRDGLTNPEQPESASLTPLVRQVLADAVAEPGPPPAALAAQVYARGLQARRRRQVITAVAATIVLIAVVVGVATSTAVLRPDAAPIGPAVTPSGARSARPSTAPSTGQPSPSGGSSQAGPGTLSSPPAISPGTPPGQQAPVFSVSDASGPYCGTDPAEGATVRSVLPANDRWGPDLPAAGICSYDMRGVELPVIQGSRVGEVSVMTYLVNPRAAQTTACRGTQTCEQLPAGWLGTSSGGTQLTLVTPDGTQYSVGADALFENSDLYDGGKGKLPALPGVPYTEAQLRQLVLALAQHVHVQ